MGLSWTLTSWTFPPQSFSFCIWIQRGHISEETSSENGVSFWVWWLLVCYGFLQASLVGFTSCRLASIYRKIRGKISRQTEIPFLRFCWTRSAWPVRHFLGDITHLLNFSSVTAGWSFQPQRRWPEAVSRSWWRVGLGRHGWQAWSAGSAEPPKPTTTKVCVCCVDINRNHSQKETTQNWV